MKNNAASSMGGMPEHNETSVGARFIAPSGSGSVEEQIFLDYLLELGFAWEEAQKLISLRENLCENAEMRQRLSDDCRMHFARWLYEQGEIREA
ncbi:MAG TPA: hypothetical protein VJ761_18515 [Ktedonobacteraceae bacterium]|nr:hypothetical protein [Ktedonobacteraceae bacterium]